MATYKIKSKLFAKTGPAPKPKYTAAQRKSYQAGIDKANKLNAAKINDLQTKNTNLQTQLDTANKGATELNNQITSLTKANQELQDKPGMGSGALLGVTGTLAGMVGLGKYRQKKEEEQYQQLENPNQVY